MNETIKQAIQKIANSKHFPSILRATVLAVDKNAMTVQVQLLASDAILEDVKIKPITCEGDKTQMGVILFPAVNSLVLVGQVEDESLDTCLLSLTQIESITLDTQTAFKLLIDNHGNLNLNTAKMVLNQGNNGGIPLVNPLTKTIAELQTKVNTIISAFTTHTHAVAGAATAIPNPIVPVLQPETIVQVSDLANPDIAQ